MSKKERRLNKDASTETTENLSIFDSIEDRSIGELKITPFNLVIRPSDRELVIEDLKNDQLLDDDFRENALKDLFNLYNNAHYNSPRYTKYSNVLLNSYSTAFKENKLKSTLPNDGETLLILKENDLEILFREVAHSTGPDIKVEIINTLERNFIIEKDYLSMRVVRNVFEYLWSDLSSGISIKIKLHPRNKKWSDFEKYVIKFVYSDLVLKNNKSDVEYELLKKIKELLILKAEEFSS